MKNVSTIITQPAAEDIFTMQEQQIESKKENVEMILLEALSAFESHPFKLSYDEEFRKLVDSIRENGVLIPAIARPKDGGYELISGHRCAW